MQHAARAYSNTSAIRSPTRRRSPRAKLEEIFADIQSDLRYDHELNGCLNCGICTATCPAAHYYDFSPREIVQLLWTENLEGIYDAMQEKIWACAQCYTCAARCPFGNSPGGLVMLMRETAIKHGMESAKNVLRPFSRVMLKLISTGNQLVAGHDQQGPLPRLGPEHLQGRRAAASCCARRSRCPRSTPPRRPGRSTSRPRSSSTRSGKRPACCKQLETIDENLFDVITDIMDEKRESWKDWLEEQERGLKP